MARKGKNAGGQEEPATLPLKKPGPKMDRVQVIAAAAGLPSHVEVQAVRKSILTDGKEGVEYQITWSMTPEQLEIFNKMFDVKIFDPDKDKDTISFEGWNMRREAPGEAKGDGQQKFWVSKEGSRRSKPKTHDGKDGP